MASHIPQKPRILLLSTAYLPLVGGSELAIQHITDRLDGYEFNMVTGRYGAKMAKEEQVGRVRVFRVGGALHTASFVVPKALLPLAIAFKAWRLARTQRYALVHVYQASQAAGGAWLLSWLLPRLPILVTIQEGKDLQGQGSLIRWFRERILKRATAITTISNHLAEYVREHTSAPVSVIPNGVNFERFVQRPAIEVMRAVHEHMGVGPHHKIIISISRLVPKNGLANLIRALAIVRKNIVHDEPVLMIVGTGAQEDELKHISLLEGVSDAVHFLGHVEHNKLPGYLHGSHMFARPSLSEGLGNAFLEAMASGTPVVASRVGGIADFLEDGKTGFVCDPEDPVSIAHALERAFVRDESTKAIIERAKEIVHERFTWENVSTDMEKVYREIIHES